ncbi:hypothetical protein TNCV_666251 [Trichonephila clavipes]|uniref:Uncharacterized protein n=1 Tax=Trichonephila clavipes TaxID=2585209 RepID=A0A8X6SKE4_TRICX|nr:hypothetical protein TNCV_666251 [Trichonephila clavipes]
MINAKNEQRLVQGHETPLRVKGDNEDVSSELDNGIARLIFVFQYTHTSSVLCCTPSHLKTGYFGGKSLDISYSAVCVFLF